MENEKVSVTGLIGMLIVALAITAVAVTTLIGIKDCSAKRFELRKIELEHGHAK